MKMISLQTDRKHRRVKKARYTPIGDNTVLITQKGSRYYAGEGVVMKRRRRLVSSKTGIVQYRHSVHGKIIVSVAPMDLSLGMNHEKFLKKAGINGQSLFDYLSVNGAVVKEDFVPLEKSVMTDSAANKSVSIKLDRLKRELILQNLQSGYYTVFGIGTLQKKARRRMTRLANKGKQR
ncbi:MAG TPA: hypothetical protein CFH83_01225 [Sulfuricurvum kujiense]|uniref:Uncharacterized protein n=2 Tax=Sulfuricurvum kujiense TaxID=148813 RepID=A0A2D3WHH1_9BACT|nr:MAG TPA: hypothetical protein CFH83_01225 [Sulfuricurvum kujiense]